MLTIALYALFFVLVFISFKPLVKPIVLSDEKTISLAHITLVQQEKKVIEEKNIQKEEPKIKPLPKPEKKIEKKPEEKPKPTLKKEPIKKEKPKPVEKKHAKKSENKKIEEEPKKQIEKKEAKKEETKEQEALQKSNPKSYEEQFLDEHLQAIVKQIQKHIVYPKRAKQLNIQGEVVLEFTILKDGSIENIKALQGHILLKKSALSAIKKASQFFPKVQKTMTIKVPIVYSLVK
jgi:protein TonB